MAIRQPSFIGIPLTTVSLLHRLLILHGVSITLCVYKSMHAYVRIYIRTHDIKVTTAYNIYIYKCNIIYIYAATKHAGYALNDVETLAKYHVTNSHSCRSIQAKALLPDHIKILHLLSSFIQRFIL